MTEPKGTRWGRVRVRVTRKRDCKASQDWRLGSPQGNARLGVWISPSRPVQTCWLALPYE